MVNCSVYDGMGSTPRAFEAAWHVGESLIDFFKNQGKPCPSQLSERLYKANQEIFDWEFVDQTRIRHQGHQGGCAGTIAWLYNGLHVFHAGDTRALLLRGDGQEDDGFDTITTDHAEGHLLYRYFGMGNGLEIEQRYLPVAEGDILVLMTDGVTNVLRGNEIATQVRTWVLCRSGSAGHAAQNLCKLARALGSRDDITSIIVEIVSIED